MSSDDRLKSPLAATSTEPWLQVQGSRHFLDWLAEMRVSLAFTISFRASDRTLTDDEVATLRGQLIDAVTTKHRAELRG